MAFKNTVASFGDPVSSPSEGGVVDFFFVQVVVCLGVAVAFFPGAAALLGVAVAFLGVAAAFFVVAFLAVVAFLVTLLATAIIAIVSNGADEVVLLECVCCGNVVDGKWVFLRDGAEADCCEVSRVTEAYYVDDCAEFPETPK